MVLLASSPQYALEIVMFLQQEGFSATAAESAQAVSVTCEAGEEQQVLALARRVDPQADVLH